MITTTDENGVVRPYGWILVAVIGVDESQAIPCECQNCGRRVYARIHFIEWPDGSLECWGSGCFRKELGAPTRESKQAVAFPEIAGRRMTPDELAMLLSNRVALKAWFQTQRDEGEKKRRADEERKVRAKQAEQEAFVKSLENLPPVSLLPRPVSTSRGFTPVLSSLHVKAQDNVAKKWEHEGVDHSLPGFSSLFDKEVQKEIERLKRSGE